MVLDDVIDKLWDRAINRSTRAVYEAGFRAFHRFSNLYPSGSLSRIHPAISEDIFIYFVTHCVDALQLKYSTIKTYLAGTRFAYIKAGFQDPCCFPNGQQYLRLRAILKAVKKSQDNTVKTKIADYSFYSKPMLSESEVRFLRCKKLTSSYFIFSMPRCTCLLFLLTPEEDVSRF